MHITVSHKSISYLVLLVSIKNHRAAKEQIMQSSPQKSTENDSCQMAGASGSTCRTGSHHWHLARETRRLSWALKIYSTTPSVRGVVHWASPRPQRWRWLEACRKTANSLATPDRTNTDQTMSRGVEIPHMYTQHAMRPNNQHKKQKRYSPNSHH